MPKERKAALINAYNPFTVNWVVQNYPVKSIWRTSRPFGEVRHVLDGGKVSLDQIETELRNMGDPRIHGVLVCAALSCPPLRREAYVPEDLAGNWMTTSAPGWGTERSTGLTRQGATRKSAVSSVGTREILRRTAHPQQHILIER